MLEKKEEILNKYTEIVKESFSAYSSLDGFPEFIESISIEKFKTFPHLSNIDGEMIRNQILFLFSKNIFNEKIKKHLIKNGFVDAMYFKLKDFLLKNEKHEELAKLISFHEKQN